MILSGFYYTARGNAISVLIDILSYSHIYFLRVFHHHLASRVEVIFLPRRRRVELVVEPAETLSKRHRVARRVKFAAQKVIKQILKGE